jgi:hypothetical protein
MTSRQSLQYPDDGTLCNGDFGCRSNTVQRLARPKVIAVAFGRTAERSNEPLSILNFQRDAKRQRTSAGAQSRAQSLQFPG